MHRKIDKLLIGGTLIAMIVTALPVAAQDQDAAEIAEDREKIAERVREAGITLEEILNAPDKKVPAELLEEAHCLAVLPKVVKAGFIVGGRRGKGLLSCRNGDGWSRPLFVTLTGGSFGLQIGAQATDFVLVFASESAKENLFEDKFTLGGDASVAAGPVGRTAEAGTDVELDHEIYSYSRSKGVFAGVSIEGAELSIDEDANEAMYGKDITARSLLMEQGDAPEVVQPFIAKLASLVPGEHRGNTRR